MSRLTELERLDIGNNDFTEIPEGKFVMEDCVCVNEQIKTEI